MTETVPEILVYILAFATFTTGTAMLAMTAMIIRDMWNGY